MLPGCSSSPVWPLLALTMQEASSIKGGLTSPSVKASVLAAASRNRSQREETVAGLGSGEEVAGGESGRLSLQKQDQIENRGWFCPGLSPQPPRRTVQALLQFMIQ